MNVLTVPVTCSGRCPSSIASAAPTGSPLWPPPSPPPPSFTASSSRERARARSDEATGEGVLRPASASSDSAARKQAVRSLAPSTLLFGAITLPRSDGARQTGSGRAVLLCLACVRKIALLSPEARPPARPVSWKTNQPGGRRDLLPLFRPLAGWLAASVASAE